VKRRQATILLVLLVVIGGVAAVVLSSKGSSSTNSLATTTPKVHVTAPPTSTTSTTQAPGPGFVAGKVTAIGDSVMIDYQQPLQEAIPGITVDGTVSRQWDTGIGVVNQMKAAGTLGATVIIGLSTNGPITAAQFDAMQSALAGASRVIYVHVHVDREWQDPNNQVLADGVARSKNAVLVDWNALASQNPSWFGSDGTHLAINGSGAQALAQLIASKVS
jgi:lysophospholipase L1-like esterase